MMMVMVRETATAAASALFSGDRETPDFEMHALSSKSIESFVSVCSCVFSARQLSAADCECSLCSHTHSTVCGHFSLSFFRSRCGHKKCEEWSTTFGWHSIAQIKEEQSEMTMRQTGAKKQVVQHKEQHFNYAH